MVGGENIAASLNQNGKEPPHLSAYRIEVFPEHRVETAVYHYVLPEFLLDLFGIHAGLHLQRMDGVETKTDDVGQQSRDVSAGMQPDPRSPGVSPVDRPLVRRLYDLPEDIRRKELRLLVAQVIPDIEHIEGVAGLPCCVEKPEVQSETMLDPSPRLFGSLP